jgi:aspartokinase
MVNISHIVKKQIESRAMLYEALANEVVSYAALAEYLKPHVESELGRKAKEPAIVMAIRRYAEQISRKEHVKIPFRFDSEIIMKTGLVDVTFARSSSLPAKLKRIFDLVDYGRGETINMIHGNYETTIILNKKYSSRLIAILEGEKLVNMERDAVSFTMTFSKDFMHTPGILSKATRKLQWEDINILESISTATELIFIVSKKDTIKTYDALQQLIEEKN